MATWGGLANCEIWHLAYWIRESLDQESKRETEPCLKGRGKRFEGASVVFIKADLMPLPFRVCTLLQLMPNKIDFFVVMILFWAPSFGAPI